MTDLNERINELVERERKHFDGLLNKPLTRAEQQMLRRGIRVGLRALPPEVRELVEAVKDVMTWRTEHPEPVGVRCVCKRCHDWKGLAEALAAVEALEGDE